jgi:hypothetical protein
MDAISPDILPLEGMRLMLRHWAAARGNGKLPLRPPFDPLHCPSLLRVIQMHERKQNGRFLCRVSGTGVVEAYGFESTGRYMDETVNPVDLASRTAIMNHAIDHGAPIYYTGRLVIPGCEWKGMQRLLLPFADQDGHRCFLLSILNFLANAPAQTDEHGIATKLVLCV